MPETHRLCGIREMEPSQVEAEAEVEVKAVGEDAEGDEAAAVVAMSPAQQTSGRRRLHDSAKTPTRGRARIITDGISMRVRWVVAE